MTLQSSNPISLGDVLNELKIANPSRALPIALGDSDVRSLAGVPSGNISLTDLLGKSAIYFFSSASWSSSTTKMTPYAGATARVTITFNADGSINLFRATSGNGSGSTVKVTNGWVLPAAAQGDTNLGINYDIEFYNFVNGGDVASKSQYPASLVWHQVNDGVNPAVFDLTLTAPNGQQKIANCVISGYFRRHGTTDIIGNFSINVDLDADAT